MVEYRLLHRRSLRHGAGRGGVLAPQDWLYVLLPKHLAHRVEGGGGQGGDASGRGGVRKVHCRRDCEAQGPLGGEQSAASGALLQLANCGTGSIHFEPLVSPLHILRSLQTR